MDSVGVYEAKTHLASLLDRVAQGEEVVITRHGRAVARLVPAEPDEAKASVRALAEEIRTSRKGFRVKADELGALVARGRRF
ncbi:MAG TPA: type II toxin-antitoxin system prevent-host-death family antitoxin [Dokdonella sp.]